MAVVEVDEPMLESWIAATHTVPLLHTKSKNRETGETRDSVFLDLEFCVFLLPFLPFLLQVLAVAVVETMAVVEVDEPMLDSWIAATHTFPLLHTKSKNRRNWRNESFSF